MVFGAPVGEGVEAARASIRAFIASIVDMMSLGSVTWGVGSAGGFRCGVVVVMVEREGLSS